MAQAVEDVVNVHSGPGEDYPIIGTMVKGEVRPLIGRAEFAEWWNIQFHPTANAWVADEDVDEYGDTGSLALVEPPPIDGNTPTPGPVWRPTALPVCTPTPTATLTPSPTLSPTTTPTTMPTETATSTVEVSESASSDTNDPEGGSVTAAPEDTELVTAPPQVTSNILPVVGAGLLGLGVILGLMARRRGDATAGSGSEGESGGS
jgi:hypothetical protein